MKPIGCLGSRSKCQHVSSDETGMVACGAERSETPWTQVRYVMLIQQKRGIRLGQNRPVPEGLEQLMQPTREFALATIQVELMNGNNSGRADAINPVIDRGL